MNRNDEKESGNQNVNSKKYATVVGKPSGHLRGHKKYSRKGEIGMKSVIIYYSYTGKTRELAEKTARDIEADLIEIKEKRNRSTFNAYVCGSLAARRQKKTEIKEVTFDLSEYEKVIVAVPIWAGFPSTPFNNILELLPEGKEIELILTSGSGNSKGSKEKTISLAKQKNIKVIKYTDVKTTK